MQNNSMFQPPLKDVPYMERLNIFQNWKMRCIEESHSFEDIKIKIVNRLDSLSPGYFFLLVNELTGIWIDPLVMQDEESLNDIFDPSELEDIRKWVIGQVIETTDIDRILRSAMICDILNNYDHESEQE